MTPNQLLPTSVPHPIEADRVGVRYNLRFTRKTTIRGAFKNLARRREGPTHFWALRDVSFKVAHGESLAVIGPNGAGKSTLLQVLAGILTPNEGGARVVGTVASLLTLGAGFDDELSGRDNIMLAGAFLGIEHKEMTRRLDSIIEFADIGAFIDAPIRTYSQGMKARVGFSIATSVDPDILLLDEVLATGDAVFREKSRMRVEEMVRSAGAVVLVTHDMNWVTEFCNRAILLEKGQIVAEGEPATVVALHLEHSEQSKRTREAEVEAARLARLAAAGRA